MNAGNWLNKDNLYLEFGTTKSATDNGGEFKTYGDLRVVDVFIDCTKLTSTAAIQSFNTMFPSGANIFIEQVVVDCEVALTSGTTFSVGLIQDDQSTIPSNYSTAFINAEVTATFDTAGKKVTYVTGTSKAGGLIGSFPASATGPNYYITALAAGTYATGQIRVRIYYRGIGTITQ